MWKLTIRSILASKVRFALTAVAIILGVGFITAANVLGDGLRASFADLSDEITAGTDLEIRPVDGMTTVERSTETTAQQVAGVRIAAGYVEAPENSVLPIKADGTTIESVRPPQLLFSWAEDDQLNSSAIEVGRAPTGAAEWVIDFDSAETHGFIVGETYDLIVPGADGRVSAELVGTLRFGEDNTTNGATIMAVERTFAQRIVGTDGLDTAVAVAIDGSRSLADVEADMNAAVGETAVVLDTADLNAEQRAEFNAFIDIFAWALRAFAIVALFVSIFIIANTFNIVMSQRVRELGLLRAVGATPRQVRRAVLAESAAVGLFASLIGLAVGLGLAYGIEALLGVVGAELPPFDKTISLMTAAIALLIGVGVTVASAALPARKAGLISPTVAISGRDETAESGGRRMLALGAALLVCGSGLTSTALFSSDMGTSTVLALLGVGAALFFIGITLVSPLVAGPLSRALGTPLRKAFGTPGRLAGENAARNPKRTATTAAALMIGLSFVSLALVVGASYKAQLDQLLSTTIQADYAAFAGAEDVQISPAAVTDMEALEHVGVVSGVRSADGRITDLAGAGGSEEREIDAIGPDALTTLVDLDVQSGDLGRLTSDSVALQADVATTLGVALGDVVEVGALTGAMFPLEVIAVFGDGTVFEGAIVSPERFADIDDKSTVDWIMAAVADGSSASDAEADIASLRIAYPNLTIQSSAEYRETVSGQVDQMLSALTAFLGLAILIAFIGIVNTLALSVFERTREIGLLRAVGMTRRQLRRMVRWEAAIVAGIGSLLGAAVGVSFGAIITTALPADIIDTLAVPIGQIAVLVLAASAAGLLAGVLPARRAGNLDVLDAIG